MSKHVWGHHSPVELNGIPIIDLLYGRIIQWSQNVQEKTVYGTTDVF